MSISSGLSLGEHSIQPHGKYVNNWPHLIIQLLATAPPRALKSRLMVNNGNGPFSKQTETSIFCLTFAGTMVCQINCHILFIDHHIDHRHIKLEYYWALTDQNADIDERFGMQIFHHANKIVN